MAARDHTAHVIDSSGVTPTPFTRNDDGTWGNTEKITLAPGAVLDLGGGLSIANGQPVEFTYTMETEA